MSAKIDIRAVIADHFRTLHDDSTKRVSIIDLGLFFGLPILVASISILLWFSLGEPAVTASLTAMSVFSGLLINVLVLIYTVSQNVGLPTQTRSADDVALEKQILKEIFANVSFSILVSSLTVVLLITTYFHTNDIAQKITTAIALLLMLNFFLTLLMAIKRLHYLLMAKLK
jgi:hypothetical protein